MRELKFRAWDRTTNKLKEVLGILTLQKLVALRETKDTMVYVNECEVDIMQYTGLKDKNGKEIYEGDIVNKIGIVSEEVFELKKDYIEINTPQLGNVLIFTDILYDRKTGYKELLVKENTNGILSETQNYEVIGNIYKNPELLEGEE